MSALSIAYYQICDDPNYTQEEYELIAGYMDKFGTAMSKAISRDYYTQ